MRRLGGTAVALVTVGVVLVAAVSSASASAKGVTPHNPLQRTTTIEYGPFTVPAATMPMDPAMDGIDMTGMGMIHNRFDFDVAKPCSGCYITSITPNLVYPNGSTANVDSGLWLHHTVLFDQGPGRADATCGTSGLGSFGERFFASGNERSEMVLPSRYGYPVGPTDRWNSIVDLMNMNMEPATVSLSLTFTWVPAASNARPIGHNRIDPRMRPVRPVWLDVNECGNSEFQVPAGPSSTPWSWTATVGGDVVAIGGHIHDYGVDIYADNDTTGQRICDSVASYGTTPDYVDMLGMAHVSEMSGCLGGPGNHPVGHWNVGDTISIHAQYNPPVEDPEVMGIMIAYLASRY